jgi:hypothetical protein
MVSKVSKFLGIFFKLTPPKIIIIIIQFIIINFFARIQNIWTQKNVGLEMDSKG